jgi:hypothetical protein
MEDPTSRYTAPEPTGAAPGSAPGATPGPAPAATTPPGPAPSTPPPPPPPQPAWRPPPADHGRNASLIFGLIILIIGLWFFASRTLGLDLPDIEWSQLWPLILIGIGAWIVVGAVRRNN